MTFTFTPSYRGGSGSPMVCLHGFTDTWRSWELVLPALERHHDVLALTLPGHAGGPALTPELTDDTLVDRVEQSIDAAGIQEAHLVGNSLGGYIALRLAARGRARSVARSRPRVGGPTATHGCASCCASSDACSSRPRQRLRTPMRSRLHQRAVGGPRP